MKMKAAVLWEPQTDWSIEEVELDPPKAGEVLVQLVGSGLCHSDEHLLTGDLALPEETQKELGMQQFPVIGGHEGAGTVLEVGDGVYRPEARRPRRLRVHPVVRQVPELLDRPPEPVRPRRLPARRPPGHRLHVAPPRQGPGPRPDVLHRHVRRVHRRLAGQLHQDRGRHPARQGGARRMRRDHRLGLGRVRRRRAARRDRRHRRLRRRRHERRAGRLDVRRPPRDRRRSAGVQAGAGAGLRSDPLGRRRSRRPPRSSAS